MAKGKEGGGDTAVLDEIQESLEQTGAAIKAVGDSVDATKANVGKQDTRITEVTKSVEQIVNDLETSNKSLENHIILTRAALKQLPAGNKSVFLGRHPYRTSANERHSVTFASQDACKAFGMFVMGHCAADPDVRKAMLIAIEKRKNEPFYGGSYKAMAAGDFVAGGALVPDEMLAELIFNIEEHGVFQQNARRIPMGASTITIPKRTGGLTIYYPDENVDITPSDPTTGDVMLTARLYATLTKWPNELIEDMAIDWGAWIAEEIVDAHATARDTNGFTGTGLSTQARVNGVLNQGDVVTHILGNSIGASATDTGKDTFGELVYADLVYMQGLIPTKARRNAKWYMHRHILAIIKAIVTTAGDPVVVDVNTPLGSVSKLAGDPVVEVDVLPSASDDAVTTDFMFYGDLRLAYGYGERRILKILNSLEAGFAADQTWVRSTSRIAIAAMDGTQLVKARTSTT